jgi:hypothetical protein
VILLVLVAVLWVVVLAPSVVRRFTEREGAGSIDHFHHQLQLLQHAGPKSVNPAYRLHTAHPGGGRDGGSTSTFDLESSRPRLVLLRQVGDARSADIADVDGANYERIGVIERPEPSVSPAQTQAGLAAYRRQQSRQRCTLILRLLTAAAISTAILGFLPSFRLAWIFTGLTGLAALGLVGLIAYAREVEGQRARRSRPARIHREPSFRDDPMGEELYRDEQAHGDGHDRFSYDDGAAQAGFPGAWDDDMDEDEPPLRRASGGR